MYSEKLHRNAFVNSSNELLTFKVITLGIQISRLITIVNKNIHTGDWAISTIKIKFWRENKDLQNANNLEKLFHKKYNFTCTVAHYSQH